MQRQNCLSNQANSLRRFATRQLSKYNQEINTNTIRRLTVKSKVLLCSALLSALAAGVQAQEGANGQNNLRPTLVKLKNQVPALAARSHRLGPLADNQRLQLALALPLRNQAALNSLLNNLYDPTAPQFGNYLTPAQFAQQFGPAEADYRDLSAFVQQRGLKTTGVHANRLLLDVEGNAADIARAFHVHLSEYQAPDGHRFYAPDTDPTIPSNLAGKVSGVIGLDNAQQPYPIARRAPGAGLMPFDISTGYNLPINPHNGAGQTLGLMELDGYTQSDITFYENNAKFDAPNFHPNVPLTNVLVGGFNGIPGANAGEVTLDIELQIALAPGANGIRVYEGPNTLAGLVDTFNQIATDNLAKEISTSWGLAEVNAPPSLLSTENAIFQQIAAQGQSLFAASGDHGAFAAGYPPKLPDVEDPASQPWVTCVGGTTLKLGMGDVYLGESTWNDIFGASGGGISNVWPIPSYQAQPGVITAASKGSHLWRNVPDVCLDGDPGTGYAIYLNNNWSIWGGTSCAAPLWAAFTAVVNQQRVQNGLALLGFPNPALYSLALGPNYHADFNDIVLGNNGTNAANGYPAVPGYDLATGWGSFRPHLLADLGGTLSDFSPYQIDAGGGAAYPFQADMDFTGGFTNNTANAISVAGVLNPAPHAVYQTERYGTFSYSIPDLAPNAPYTVRLHFAEIYYTAVGQRQFDVSINGNPVLSNFDIFYSAGGGYVPADGKNQALVEQFDVQSNNLGVITIDFTNVVGGAKVSGIEVLPQDYYPRNLPGAVWTATASSSYPIIDQPFDALDGTTGTRWTSGLHQAPGQWFSVDMKAVHDFSKIVLDNSNTAFDYPRSYQVWVWSSPLLPTPWSPTNVGWVQVSTGSNPSPGYTDDTIITFPTVQTARAITIVQTGSDPVFWWSIGEFYVYP